MHGDGGHAGREAVSGAGAFLRPCMLRPHLAPTAWAMGSTAPCSQSPNSLAPKCPHLYSVHGATMLGAGVSEADVQRRVAEAVEAARRDAEAEADDSMTDLLVCLGQEERKVQLLSEQLAARGVDVEAILASIVEEEAEGEGQQA